MVPLQLAEKRGASLALARKNPLRTIQLIWNLCLLVFFILLRKEETRILAITSSSDLASFLRTSQHAASPARLTQWSEELSSTVHDWDRRRWEQILFHSLLIFFLLHLVDTIGWFTLLVICPKGLLSGWYFSTDKRIVLKWWLTKYLVLVFPVWCGLRFRCPFALWLFTQ